jgi:hypothetical protein
MCVLRERKRDLCAGNLGRRLPRCALRRIDAVAEMDSKAEL